MSIESKEREQRRNQHIQEMNRAVCPYCLNYGHEAFTYHAYGIGIDEETTPLFECNKCKRTFDPLAAWRRDEDGTVRDHLGIFQNKLLAASPEAIPPTTAPGEDVKGIPPRAKMSEEGEAACEKTTVLFPGKTFDDEPEKVDFYMKKSESQPVQLNPRNRRRAHLSFKRNGTIYDEEIEMYDTTEDVWNVEVGHWLSGVHKRAKAGAQARAPK